MLPFLAVALMAAAPTTIATTTSATVVGAAGGWTAWSALEGGRYVLVTRAPDGTISRPPVAPRGVPFDLDLGVDGSGRVVAAYSRCAKEPPKRGGANTILPQWTFGDGCTIQVLDLATGGEFAVPRAAGDASEVLPSVGGASLAYVAVPPSGAKAFLMVRDSGTGATRRLDDGTRRRAAKGKLAEGPASVDTDGRRVASVWHFVNREFASFEAELRTQAVGAGRPTVVASATIIEDCKYETLLSPTLTGGSVFYLDTKGSAWGLGRTPEKSFKPAFGARSLAAKQWIPASAAVDGGRVVVSETRTRVRGRVSGATRVVQRSIGRFVARTPVACG